MIIINIKKKKHTFLHSLDNKQIFYVFSKPSANVIFAQSVDLLGFVDSYLSRLKNGFGESHPFRTYFKVTAFSALFRFLLCVTSELFFYVNRKVPILIAN